MASRRTLPHTATASVAVSDVADVRDIAGQGGDIGAEFDLPERLHARSAGTRRHRFALSAQATEPVGGRSVCLPLPWERSS